MSPKSILQFLAVCGSAQVAEAFAAKPTAFSEALAVEIESNQVASTPAGQDFHYQCPCYTRQECKFQGLGDTLNDPVPLPTGGSVMWDENPELFVNWTNKCWNDCYKDPDVSLNGTEATYWSMCSPAADQFRLDACETKWGLTREERSVFYGSTICGGQAQTLSSDDMCQLIKTEKPKRLPTRFGCQSGMEAITDDRKAAGKRALYPKTCNQLWGSSMNMGFPYAYTCKFMGYRSPTEKYPNGKPKCQKDSEKSGILYIAGEHGRGSGTCRMRDVRKVPYI